MPLSLFRLKAEATRTGSHEHGVEGGRLRIVDTGSASRARVRNWPDVQDMSLHKISPDLLALLFVCQ